MAPNFAEFLMPLSVKLSKCSSSSAPVYWGNNLEILETKSQARISSWSTKSSSVALDYPSLLWWFDLGYYNAPLYGLFRPAHIFRIISRNHGEKFTNCSMNFAWEILLFLLFVNIKCTVAVEDEKRIVNQSEINSERVNIDFIC